MQDSISYSDETIGFSGLIGNERRVSFSVFKASCPHAAAISLPLVYRQVTTIPLLSKIARKPSIDSF